MKNEDKKIEGASTPPTTTHCELDGLDRSKSHDFAQATIGFCPHEEPVPYFIGLRDLPRDQSLSILCRLLIVYLWTNADTWEIRMSHLIKEFKDHAGRNKMYAAMNEAIEAGYIRKELITNGNLKAKIKYYISRHGKFKKSFRFPGFGDTEARDPENRHTKDITKEKIYKKEKKEEGGASPSSNPLTSLPSSKKKAQQPKEEVAPRVMLDSVQQKSLLDKLGGSLELRQKCYEKLSDWKIGKNKTDCKSDYLAICNWVIGAVKDETLSSTAVGTNYYEKDKNLAIKIRTTFRLRKDIDIGYDYIEFCNGTNAIPTHLNFGSKDFTPNVLKEVRKRNLPTDGL